ncbi:response regulator [Pseudomonas carnis]|uniref:response regulator n=1 Tax=Pseudomonas carnis TaxID=2487355 RepID=UPI0018E7C172|nr:response regulator [Pseudomonas carnis]MBJ2216014.1 response regulator [Pseudomonas carnis]
MESSTYSFTASMPEIHVTKFNGILSGVKGIIGSTEIHDGTPAIVLDVIELARLNLTNTSDGGFKPKLYRIRRIRRESKPLVLIVDDSNSYRRVLTTHFKDLGWEVAVARDGQDALDTLPSLGKITLFVVDVEMPRMDGLALTRNLRSQQHYDDIPIIMLTTRSNLQEEALELGVNHFLSKPYAGGILNEAIKAACPALELAGAA